MYLGWRLPVVINVSYFYQFKDSSKPVLQSQVSRAAALISGCMAFRDMLVRWVGVGVGVVLSHCVPVCCVCRCSACLWCDQRARSKRTNELCAAALACRDHVGVDCCSLPTCCCTGFSIHHTARAFHRKRCVVDKHCACACTDSCSIAVECPRQRKTSRSCIHMTTHECWCCARTNCSSLIRTQWASAARWSKSKGASRYMQLRFLRYNTASAGRPGKKSRVAAD